jgi:hypothetical protein
MARTAALKDPEQAEIGEEREPHRYEKEEHKELPHGTSPLQ